MASADKTERVNVTTIGPSIVIKGRLKVDEDLTVQGRIDAEISSSKALVVENSGIVKADVRVQSARISGVLVGNITAQDKIEIASDGRVVGDLRAPRIVISDGAAFRGKIEMQGLDERRDSEIEVVPALAVVAAPAPNQVPAMAPIPVPEPLRGNPGRPKQGGRH
jgi:cytoskeletal protein CcmA (bactofilin family)